MHIKLNGQPHELEKELTLSDLLASLGLSGKPIVAEINCEAVIPRNFPTIEIKADDRVEIITLAAGG